MLFTISSRGKWGKNLTNHSGEFRGNQLPFIGALESMAGTRLRALHDTRMASSEPSLCHYPHLADECTEAWGPLTPTWGHISLAAQENVAHTLGNPPLLCYSIAQIIWHTGHRFCDWQVLNAQQLEPDLQTGTSFMAPFHLCLQEMVNLPFHICLFFF